MLFQCPACRALVAVTSARLEPARAGLDCPECHETTWLPAEGASKAAGAPALQGPAPSQAGSGALSAPAPGAPSPPAAGAAPPRAGTDARGPAADAPAWVDDAKARLAALPPPPPEGAFVVEGFSALFSRWDDEAAHKQLVQQASIAGQLAALGVRYRAVLEVCPEEPRAKQAQQSILAAAMATLAPGNAAPVDTRRSKRYLTIAAVAVSALAFMFVLGGLLGLLKGN